MKNVIYPLTLIFVFLSQLAFSQFKDGQYRFVNNDATLEFEITGNGMIVSTAKVTFMNTKKSVIGNGKFTTLNDISWYEFQADGCRYEIDGFLDVVLLYKSDCKDGGPKISYTLLKAGPDFNGTYKNTKGGVLIISNFIEEASFDYKFTQGKTATCPSFNLTGTAIIEPYTSNAKDKIDSKISFNFADNQKINFFPNKEGTEPKCLYSMDIEFKK
jgi:hypothetical protein